MKVTTRTSSSKSAAKPAERAASVDHLHDSIQRLQERNERLSAKNLALESEIRRLGLGARRGQEALETAYEALTKTKSAVSSVLALQDLNSGRGALDVLTYFVNDHASFVDFEEEAARKVVEATGVASEVAP